MTSKDVAATLTHQALPIALNPFPDGVGDPLSDALAADHAPPISQELLNGDRQVPHSLADRVIHGVGDRRRHRYRGELAEPLGADRARLLVELADEKDVELGNIRIRRYEVT